MDQGLKSKTLKTFRKKKKKKKKTWETWARSSYTWTPKAQSIKGKVDKLNLIKIKTFCSVRLS